MSALGLSEQERPESGIWSTRDPMLACTLGTLGFPARGTQPAMVVYDARRIVAASSKGVSDFGGMNDLALCEISFVYEISHPVFGVLNCSMISAAHEVAKLRQKKEVGTIDNAERGQLERLAARLKQKGLVEPLVFFIQGMYDHLCNWNVLCDSIQELNRNPFLKFTRSIKRNGVAVTLNPLETEETANRRSERLFRGAE